MQRTIVVAAAVGTLAVGIAPAIATSAPVDGGRAAGTALTVTLPDKTELTLDVRAVQASQGPLLLVNANRCDKQTCESTTYSAALPTSGLSVDPKTPTADLRTLVDGAPLTIAWRPGASSGVVMGGGELQGGGTDATGSQYAGQMADVSVRWGDTSCAGTGGVGNGVVLDTAPVTGDATTAPLSTLHLPAGSVVRCTS